MSDGSLLRLVVAVVDTVAVGAREIEPDAEELGLLLDLGEALVDEDPHRE